MGEAFQAAELEVTGQTPAGSPAETLACTSTRGAAAKEAGGDHMPFPRKGELPGGGPGASCTSSLTLENGVHLRGFSGPLGPPGAARACPGS